MLMSITITSNENSSEFFINKLKRESIKYPDNSLNSDNCC